ncbi:MAG: succinate dehydrogenase cytochrome b subunit [Ferruginibacter sp.]
MTWKQFFTSSIGKKFNMALTGLFLVLFLIIHAGINSSIFLNDNGETYITIAHFMSHNWIVRFLEIGLFLGLITHSIQGIVLWRQNTMARPIAYHHKRQRGSTWYSRSMGILGSLLLIFLVIHIAHFFVGTKIALYSGDKPHNLYIEMKEVFSKWYFVVVYLAGIVALFWHLLHGFQSAWQTLGLNNRKYTPLVKIIGIGYTIIICSLFALMPLAIHFKWIN